MADMSADAERLMKELTGYLRQVYHENDEELRTEFDRSLSFQDGFFDRWERADRLGFGLGSSIYNSSLVYGKVSVAEETWIGPYTVLDGSGGHIKIGRNCSVSAGVHIYTHDTVMWALSGGKLQRQVGSVAVGDCTYIGSQSILSLGATVGSHCVVAANSFLSGNFEDLSIIAGTPAKKIGSVEIDGNEISLHYGT